ncbi:MAG: hypothetical protein KJZ98_10560 [Burkholderiaceae bacterium]|nr:hypothetical protein [Burkholderiaceae bacterium]MEB2350089.1 hypothetical protein [Burkholderiaceae bacterium]
MKIAPIDRDQTRRRLVRDRERLRSLLSRRPEGEPRRLWLHPCYQAAWLHRWSHFHFARGNRLRARSLWHLNLLLTGVDISPISDLDGGLVLLNPAGTVIVGKAGENLTVHGRVGIGGGLSPDDIGAGPGLPVLGVDVTLGFGACVLGPVRVGSRTVIEPGVIVHRDLPDDTVERSPASRRVRAGSTGAAGGES